MPKGVPPEYAKWKPGQSGNPSGRPKSILTKGAVELIISKFMALTRQELQEIVQNSTSTMLEIMVAAIMARAAKDGDYARLEALLARSVGKVKEVLETHNHNFDEALEKVPREKIVELLKVANE